LINGGVPSPYGNLTLYGNVTTGRPNSPPAQCGNTPAYDSGLSGETGANSIATRNISSRAARTVVDDEFGDDGEFV